MDIYKLTYQFPLMFDSLKFALLFAQTSQTYKPTSLIWLFSTVINSKWFVKMSKWFQKKKCVNKTEQNYNSTVCRHHPIFPDERFRSISPDKSQKKHFIIKGTKTSRRQRNTTSKFWEEDQTEMSICFSCFCDSGMKEKRVFLHSSPSEVMSRVRLGSKQSG